MSAKDIARRLLKFNEFLYNYPCQLLILVVWIGAFAFSGISGLELWFKIGLSTWVILFAWRLIKEAGKIKGTTGGPLSWLVGFNIIVVLGPLCFPMLFFLAYALKDSNDSRN